MDFVERPPEDLVGMTGHIRSISLRIAADFLKPIPQPLLEAVHETSSSIAIVYALLLDPALEKRRVRPDAMPEKIDTEMIDRIAEFTGFLDRCPPPARMPLVEMARVPLQHMSPEYYRSFRRNIDRLTGDRPEHLFEYTIRELLLRPLDVHFGFCEAYRITSHNVRQIERPLAVIFSHFAHAGNDAAEAFAFGTRNLGLHVRLQNRESLNASERVAALKELLSVDPPLKRRILGGLVECICYDGIITIPKGALLRATFAAMDAPLPSLGSSQSRTDIYPLDGDPHEEPNT